MLLSAQSQLTPGVARDEQGRMKREAKALGVSFPFPTIFGERPLAWGAVAAKSHVPRRGLREECGGLCGSLVEV